MEYVNLTPTLPASDGMISCNPCSSTVERSTFNRLDFSFTDLSKVCFTFTFNLMEIHLCFKDRSIFCLLKDILSLSPWRWGMLVDHPSGFKAEVRRWKGQGGWRPHPCQCVLWEIPGKTSAHSIQLNLTENLDLNKSDIFLLLFFLPSAPFLRQWRSDGGRLLHADLVEHEPN